MNGDGSLLSRIGLLSRLDGKTLARLGAQCVWQKFASKQIILDRGDLQQHGVYFIIEGSVRIVNYSPMGHEIAFANLHRGDFFGELAALTRNHRSASVVAVSDCQLASLGPAAFRKLVLDNPALGLQLIADLAELVQQCDQRIMDMSTLSAVQRVHAEILRQAKPDATSPGGWSVRPLPTQTEIASYVSTTRETVARAMGVLSVAGIADRGKSVLYINDYKRLSDLVENGAIQMFARR